MCLLLLCRPPALLYDHRAPGSVDMRAALAALYWRQGRNQAAEEQWNFACTQVRGVEVDGRCLCMNSACKNCACKVFSEGPRVGCCKVVG